MMTTEITEEDLEKQYKMGHEDGYEEGYDKGLEEGELTGQERAYEYALVEARLSPDSPKAFYEFERALKDAEQSIDPHLISTLPATVAITRLAEQWDALRYYIVYAIEEAASRA